MKSQSRIHEVQKHLPLWPRKRGKAIRAKEAALWGEVVIVTIPESRIPEVPKDLFAGVTGSVVVVDTGNYYPRERDGRIREIEAGMTESRWVEKQLGRPVIKAFNNIYAQHLMELGCAPNAPGRLALPVSGDDPKAKAVVMKLIDQLGFDAVDAGGLDESWRQQPGTPVYGPDLNVEGVVAALAQANAKRSPKFQATESSPGTYAKPA
jgi:8-hydroxy-5-deazaflavin:NADPH oxidoreductase